jgi:hypothetical protein
MDCAKAYLTRSEFPSSSTPLYVTGDSRPDQMDFHQPQVLPKLAPPNQTLDHRVAHSKKKRRTHTKNKRSRASGSIKEREFVTYNYEGSCKILSKPSDDSSSVATTKIVEK